jgi:hypothetical protein
MQYAQITNPKEARSAAAPPARTKLATGRPTLQRQCACGGTLAPGAAECTECRRKREAAQQQRTTGPEPDAGPATTEDLRSARQRLDAASRRFIAPHVGHDFSRVRVSADASAAESARASQFGSPLAQAKPDHAESKVSARFDIMPGRGGRSPGPVEMSRSSDPTEREAAHVAEQLFTPSPPAIPARAASGRDAGPASAAPAGPTLIEPAQQAGTPCTTCGSTGKLMGGTVDHGAPLGAATRLEMEHAFGTDLSAVRVHTNSGAAQVTRSLKARAFTFGNDIFFDQGNYNPDSMAGKRLLAHELTHTVQQRDAIAVLAREGEGRTTLQCVNENLSSAGVASWLLAIVGTTCGLIGALAGSPTGPGAAGTAAFAAAVCIAGVVGFSVGFVLGIITGCAGDPNFKSAGANPR